MQVLKMKTSLMFLASAWSNYGIVVFNINKMADLCVSN